MRNPLGGRDAADCRLAQNARHVRVLPALTENAIDFSVLPDLTDQDLEKLGVLLGHRRKMLRAIAELGVTPPRARRRLHPRHRDRGDCRGCRRAPPSHGDVLRLVGSTALSARMDPEDLRKVISTYQKCVAETVRRFGGFVAKYMGDGVLVRIHNAVKITAFDGKTRFDRTIFPIITLTPQNL